MSVRIYSLNHWMLGCIKLRNDAPGPLARSYREAYRRDFGNAWCDERSEDVRSDGQSDSKFAKTAN